MFTGADGLNIHTNYWLPAAAPKAVIQIAHGMAEHSARYDRFARRLNAEGFAVYANDHRGHGQTIPTGQVPGHMADEEGWNKAVTDLYLLNQEISSRHPGLPILLLGHSMGSFLTQQYMAEYGDSIVAAALSATNGPPGALGKIGQAVTRLEKLRVGGDGHSPVMAGMTFKAFNKSFKPNRTEFDWLSRDEAEVDKYAADPLCGFECSVATWIGMLDALTKIAGDTALSKIPKDLPIYLFSGTHDPVGENTKGVKRLLVAYEKHGFKNVSHKFYDGARHEALNETNREDVMTDFIAWANSVVD
ncbi:lysophospholipase [Sneathiella marina]|uniref:Lysophospholipase n=1 Tax=Sneathiella marina TaxID=2950108 RepID=A0ABY4WAF6_9PROT|nr:alpha/beta hydrolase [Sneathiella marina]USG62740.1 lysophospholipase [Sneathiella marina]